ncbi:MAG: hypothetical protein KME35_00180 [Aphanocapsa sp. GSE-SYN-MK-11-07L]|jgi:hypothetical protein|nr:hypothetical protein [Aphanocapsa sp. GSE-SYN-MK-11-07L]
MAERGHFTVKTPKYLAGLEEGTLLELEGLGWQAAIAPLNINRNLSRTCFMLLI